MLDFIINNAGTIIISAGLLAVITGIIIYLITAKKKGKSSCGCNCSGCALKDTCHSKSTEK